RAGFRVTGRTGGKFGRGQQPDLLRQPGRAVGVGDRVDLGLIEPGDLRREWEQRVEDAHVVAQVARVGAPDVGGTGHPPVPAEEQRVAQDVDARELVVGDVDEVVEQVDRDVEDVGRIDQTRFHLADGDVRGPRNGR